MSYLEWVRYRNQLRDHPVASTDSMISTPYVMFPKQISGSRMSQLGVGFGSKKSFVMISRGYVGSRSRVDTLCQAFGIHLSLRCQVNCIQRYRQRYKIVQKYIEYDIIPGKYALLRINTDYALDPINKSCKNWTEGVDFAKKRLILYLARKFSKNR